MSRCWPRLPVSSLILVIVGIGLSALTWLAAILLVPHFRFVVLAPTAKAGIDIILALASLFGALVLWLFSDEDTRMRLRWVAAGFVVLGLGGLVFGYVQPLLVGESDLNRSRYTSLIIQTVASAFFAAGFVSAVPRRLSPRALVVSASLAVLAGIIVYRLAYLFPVMVHVEDLDTAARRDTAMMDGLTIWHWFIAAAPLVLAVIGAWAAVRRQQREQLELWLVAAMMLLVSAQLHGMFWPAGYGPILTTASLFRLGFTLVVIVGGVVALRRIAAERAAILASERAYSRRLDQLAVLRADFTAMVAHELNAPIAAIRRFAEIATIGALAPHQREALGAIQREVEMLVTLTTDVRTSASVERDDFGVHLVPVLLDPIITSVTAYAKTLPGEHPVYVTGTTSIMVLADVERVSQVLRNVVNNAAKYSEAGTPIEIRVSSDEHKVHIEVVDQGYGIHPDDLERVTEKFGRGRDPSGTRPSGVGLGLYLSRRIVQAHGSDITIASTPGEGTSLAFSLLRAGIAHDTWTDTRCRPSH